MAAQQSSAENWLGAVWRLLLHVALVVAVSYAVYRVRYVIVWTLLAVLLACTLEPITTWLGRRAWLRRLPGAVRRALSAILVFTVLGGAVGLIGVWAFQPLSEELGALLRNLPQHQQALTTQITGWHEQYLTLPLGVRDWLAGLDLQNVVSQTSKSATDLLATTLQSGFVLIELILIPVVAFYFLTDSRSLKKDFIFLVPRPKLREAAHLLREIARVVQSYAVGQLILAVLAGIIVWVMLQVLDVRYALSLATLAGITRFIPVIGPLIGGIPIVLIAALNSPETAGIVLTAFTLMHLVESKIIMPKLIGYRVNLHPAVIIIVLLIGAEFFGLWGMFLAPPIAAVIKVLVQHLVIGPRRPVRPARRQQSDAAETAIAEERIEVDPAAVVNPGSGAGAHGVPPR